MYGYHSSSEELFFLPIFIIYAHLGRCILCATVGFVLSKPMPSSCPCPWMSAFRCHHTWPLCHLRLPTRVLLTFFAVSGAAGLIPCSPFLLAQPQVVGLSWCSWFPYFFPILSPSSLSPPRAVSPNTLLSLASALSLRSASPLTCLCSHHTCRRCPALHF